MKMIVKHHLGQMSVTAKTPRAAAHKLVGMGIQEAQLIEAEHPHTGRVISIRRGKVRIIR